MLGAGALRATRQSARSRSRRRQQCKDGAPISRRTLPLLTPLPSFFFTAPWIRRSMLIITSLIVLHHRWLSSVHVPALCRTCLSPAIQVVSKSSGRAETFHGDRGKAIHRLLALVERLLRSSDTYRPKCVYVSTMCSTPEPSGRSITGIPSTVWTISQKVLIALAPLHRGIISVFQTFPIEIERE